MCVCEVLYPALWRLRELHRTEPVMFQFEGERTQRKYEYSIKDDTWAESSKVSSRVSVSL